MNVQNGVDTQESLKPEQRLAILSFSEGRSVKEVSEQLSIPPSTLYRWYNLPSFKEGLRALLIETEKKAIHDMFAMKPLAVQTIKDCLNSKDSRTRLRAAELLLKFGIT